MTNEQLALRIRNKENTAANMALLYNQNCGMIAKLVRKYRSHAEQVMTKERSTDPSRKSTVLPNFCS